jgi:putative transposase
MSDLQEKSKASEPEVREPPHARNLRTGRVSIPGKTYAVQFCTHDRLPLLWGGLSPQGLIAAGYEADSVPGLVIEPLLWLREHGHVKVGGFVVMSDHVHAIINLAGDMTLSDVVRSVKRRSSRTVNGRLGRSGVLWQEGFYDHAIRIPKVYIANRQYIHANITRRFPDVEPETFPYSSAHPHWRERLDWDWFA